MRHLLITLTLLASLTPVAASAIEVREVKEDEVHLLMTDDLFVGGGNIHLTENVPGDLSVAGGNISISGNVAGDLQAAGGTVIVGGDVAESVRVAGGNILIEGNVGGNVIVFGGSVTIAKGVVIGGDLITGGGQIMMDGDIKGDARVYGENTDFGGIVAGNLEVQGTKLDFAGQAGKDALLVAETMTVRPETAKIAGNVRYWNNSNTADLDAVTAGTAQLDQSLRRQMPKADDAAVAAGAFLGAFAVYSLLSAALVIALLLLLTKTYFRDAAARLDKDPWMCLLFGFLFFIVTPAVALFFALTIIGIPVALLLGFWFLLAMLFAKPFTAVVLARYIERKAGKTWPGWIVFFVSIGFYIVLKLLLVVPFLGWLACAIVVCFAFGAMLMTKYDKYLAVR